MAYAVIHGSDVFIGTSGILSYELDGKMKPFFKVREINRNRSEGSYLSIDVDIKGVDGNREVKLFKSKAVVANDDIIIKYSKSRTTILRPDESIIIDVELLEPNDPSLPARQQVAYDKLDGIIRITGNYMVGEHKVHSTVDGTKIGYLSMGGNVSFGSGGLILTNNGFMF